MGVEDGDGGDIHIGANEAVTAATAVMVATVCGIILPETSNSGPKRLS